MQTFINVSTEGEIVIPYNYRVNCCIIRAVLSAIFICGSLVWVCVEEWTGVEAGGGGVDSRSEISLGLSFFCFPAAIIPVQYLSSGTPSIPLPTGRVS